MDLGLYNLKYPARKLISGLLPAFKSVDPNTISWSMLPVGAAIALVYAWAPHRPWLYLLGILLIFLRMFLGTLDGLVATAFERGTPRGEMVNRLTPELCDLMYLAALALAHPPLGIAALALAWLTSFAGMLGATVGKPTQSVGPAGQTDRLAVLQALSLLAFLGARWGWRVDFIQVFLGWVILGGSLTVLLRLGRHFRSVAP